MLTLHGRCPDESRVSRDSIICTLRDVLGASKVVLTGNGQATLEYTARVGNNSETRQYHIEAGDSPRSIMMKAIAAIDRQEAWAEEETKEQNTLQTPTAEEESRKAS